MIFNLTTRLHNEDLEVRGVTKISLANRTLFSNLVDKFEKNEGQADQEFCLSLAKEMADLLEGEYQEAYEHTPDLVTGRPKRVMIDREHALRAHLQKVLEVKGWVVEYYPPEKQ